MKQSLVSRSHPRLSSYMRFEMAPAHLLQALLLSIIYQGMTGCSGPFAWITALPNVTRCGCISRNPKDIRAAVWDMFCEADSTSLLCSLRLAPGEKPN
ncbi:hypothetical protein GN956_G2438 [Arapaima gigas]